ncbi:transporter [Streptomyces sp. NRRL F-4489]|uniref:transporter n=1 Tax=Streptomyces sp. NRRL F-4489 TaxID=1609095 RepID=UPI000749ABD1|nr:transporter [Streptomyces sp. NRRL F-4489]KUL35521.1 transporter [Streptomyces sp. NRRL F-4489]
MSTDALTAPTRPGPAAAAPSPVAVFVRLKLTLLRNGLRQSPGRAAATVISMLAALLVAAVAVLGLVALRGVPHAGALAVLLTAILTLGWAVMPLFFPSGDETMDPTRLVMLPLRPGPLTGALLVTSLVGVGPLVTLAMVTGAAVAVADGPAAALLAVPAVVLTVLVCVVLARAVATACVRLLTSRRGRDLAVLGGLFVALGGQGVRLAAEPLSRPDGLTALEPLAGVLRWLPPASAIGAVDDAGHGSYGRAAAGLALAALALVLLLWWWRRTLTALMTAPDSSTLQAVEKDSARRSGGAERGLARLLPGGHTGAVMLRSLRYAWRDPKAKMSWSMALGLGIIVPVVSALQGQGSIYTAFSASALLGMQMYNQFGQDTSAFWMVASTISTPRDAHAELRARALALALVAFPYTTLVVAGSAALIGPWSDFPQVYGISLALLGALLATGAMASALFPYSIPSEGRQSAGPGQAAIAWISLLCGFVTSAVLIAPILALTIWLHVAGLTGLLWVLLPAGALYGLAVAALGLRVAAPLVARRLPEILAAVSKG